EGVWPDALHGLLEVGLALAQLDRTVAQRRVGGGDVLRVPILQDRREERVRAVPVDGREVAAARQRGIEGPEAAGDAQRGLRHGLGEVAAGGADRADDRDGGLLAVEGGDAATALVERGEARRQVRRVAFFRRHLLEDRK